MNHDAYRRGRVAHRYTLVGACIASIAVAALVAGCSQPDPEAQSPSTSPVASVAPSTTAAAHPADSPCGLLDQATVESLIGEAPEGRETTISGSELPACHFGDIGQLGIQVAQVPAGEWAHSLPSFVDTMKSLPAGSVDPSLLDQLEEASEILQAGDEIAPDEACKYFSSLLEVSGQAPDMDYAVSYLPDLESAMAIGGTACIDGTFTSLVVAKPNIGEDAAFVNTVEAALLELAG